MTQHATSRTSVRTLRTAEPGIRKPGLTHPGHPMILKGNKYDWAAAPSEPEAVAAIARAEGVSETFAGVLVARGVDTPGAARRYLSPLSDPLPDARLLPDAARVVDRVSAAVEAGELIAVHGHDDADGVTASAIMLEALCELGAVTTSYIPDRRTEGHGLSRAELDVLKQRGVRLVITVDSCVSDREFIAYGNGLGIDTIVTDHHEIPPELPPAFAVVNPKLPDSRFPYRYMAGVGVSFRVAELLIEELSQSYGTGSGCSSWSGPRWRDESLALAAIGSIADKVPLTLDNRSIVSQGLAALPVSERPGVRAALEEGRLWGTTPEAEDVRDTLGPLLGRTPGKEPGSQVGLELLLTQNMENAHALARRLYERERRWRDTATSAWKKARHAFESLGEMNSAPLIILEVDVPIAVVGYVTSRLAEETGRPSIVLTRRDSDTVAEARGPQGFNIVEGFATMGELFRGYGGHPRAAGFSMDPLNVPEFRRRMLAFVDEHPPAPHPRQLDGEMPLTHVTVDLARELGRMRPFGQGNHRACFLSRRVDASRLAEAESLGVRFGTPVRVGSEASDLVFRLREYDGVALVSVVDTLRRDGGGSRQG
jgi:single-stranded-DNA-specific exonuclease